MSDGAWKTRIGLADMDGTVVEVEDDGDTPPGIRVTGGAFTLSVLEPEPAALRQLSAAVLDLADRIESEEKT